MIALTSRLFHRAGRVLLNVATVDYHPQAAKLFRLALVAWMLFNELLKLPYLAEFYSPQSLNLPTDPDSGALGYLLTFLRNDAIQQYYGWFYSAQIACLLAALAGFRPRVVLILAFILSENLKSLIGVTLDGGDNLATLMMFYLIFLDTSGRTHGSNPAGMLNTALTNVGVWVCRLQVVAVYATAGLLKVTGELWVHGTSIFYVLLSDHSIPLARRLVVDNEAAATLAAYSVIVYQLAFPFLVWFRKSRGPMLVIGAAFHLGIAILMGIVEFSVIMWAVYAVFFYEDWCDDLFRYARNRGEAARARLGIGTNAA